MPALEEAAAAIEAVHKQALDCFQLAVRLRALLSFNQSASIHWPSLTIEVMLALLRAHDAVNAPWIVGNAGISQLENHHKAVHLLSEVGQSISDAWFPFRGEGQLDRRVVPRAVLEALRTAKVQPGTSESLTEIVKALDRERRDYHRAVCRAVIESARTAKVEPITPECYLEMVKALDRERSELRVFAVQITPLKPPADDGEPLTIWFHGERQYSIDGKTPLKVSEEHDSVLQAFLESKAAMETSDIENKAGITNASRVMTTLAVWNNGIFKPAIRIPAGKAKGGYFARVTRL